VGKKQKLLKIAEELGRLQQVAALPCRIKDAVRGKVDAEPFATFGYIKEVGDQQIPIDAVVFPIRVKRLKADYKERKERKRKW
jgi:hypothetical protein